MCIQENHKCTLQFSTIFWTSAAKWFNTLWKAEEIVWIIFLFDIQYVPWLIPVITPKSCLVISQFSPRIVLIDLIIYHTFLMQGFYDFISPIISQLFICWHNPHCINKYIPNCISMNKGSGIFWYFSNFLTIWLPSNEIRRRS